MKPLLCGALAGLFWSGWMAAGSVSAQVTPPICLAIRDVPVLRPDNLTELVGGIKLPVTTCDGTTTLGVGNVLAITKNPSSPVLPRFADLTVLGQRVIVSSVVAQDLKFRAGLAYLPTPTGLERPSQAVIVIDNAGGTSALVYMTIETPSVVATAQTFNFGLTFLHQPNVLVQPTFNLSSRSSRLDLITGVGQLSAVGTNENVTIVATGQGYIGNLLWTADRRSGAWAVTPGPGQPTVFGGAGIYAGVFGVMRALNAGAFGLSAVLNAATEANVTAIASGTSLGAGGCPTGQPPSPPKNPAGYPEKFAQGNTFDPDRSILGLLGFRSVRGKLRRQVVRAGWQRPCRQGGHLRGHDRVRGANRGHDGIGLHRPVHCRDRQHRRYRRVLRAVQLSTVTQWHLPTTALLPRAQHRYAGSLAPDHASATAVN